MGQFRGMVLGSFEIPAVLEKGRERPNTAAGSSLPQELIKRLYPRLWSTGRVPGVTIKIELN